MKTCCIITNGFEEIEAIGTIALMKRNGLEVDLYSLNGEEVLHGKHSIPACELKPLSAFCFDDYGCLLIAGGPEWVELDKSEPFKKIIREFHDAGKYIAAICAAPTILGRMGLLKGRNYTCFTSMNADFGGTYVDQYVVTDGKLITGRSAAATVDFGIAVCEALQGTEKAEELKKAIYY